MATKRWAVSLVREMLQDSTLERSDLLSLAGPGAEDSSPEAIRLRLEEWLKNAGIEHVTGKQLRLSPCPFNSDELANFARRRILVLCVPAGTSARDLAVTFHLPTWASEDGVVAPCLEPEDDWFATPATLQPPHPGISGREAGTMFGREGKFGLSLQRYLAFLARCRAVAGEWPDRKWWTWLLRARYDRSSILIAGLDRERKVSVHAWMPSFRAKFVGARYCYLPGMPVGASREDHADYREPRSERV